MVGQGHGIANRFLGLPNPYGEENNASIVILPIPFDETSTYQKGSAEGPAALIEASRNLELYDIETQSEVYLKGIFTAADVEANDSIAMLKKAQEQVKHYLSQGKFVVCLGGEHTISYAPIKVHSDAYPGLTVLQLDAHADLQPAYEGNPWSHASVMARVKELSHVNKIVSVGIRSMSSEELINLDAKHTYYSHNLDHNANWVDDVVNALSDHVYITFDLDVFDSGIMPSTGTPEPGGLQWNQIMQLLKKVADKKKIVGFDVVELCPSKSNIAPDFLAAKLVYKLLSYIFKKESV